MGPLCLKTSEFKYKIWGLYSLNGDGFEIESGGDCDDVNFTIVVYARLKQIAVRQNQA